MTNDKMTTDQKLLPCRFTKKPVTIEAFQWHGEDPNENPDQWPDWAFTSREIDYVGIVDDFYLCIKTLEGEMLASKGDWIIKGIKGEIYPCKPDIFDATYAPENTPPVNRAKAVEALDWLIDKLDDVYGSNECLWETIEEKAQTIRAALLDDMPVVGNCPECTDFGCERCYPETMDAQAQKGGE